MISPRGSRTLLSLAGRLVVVLAILGSASLAAVPAFADSVTTPGPLQVTQITGGPAVVNQPITFTISVTNTTSSLAGGVTLGDSLPAGMTIANLLGPGGNPDLCARTLGGGKNGGAGFSCSMGDLGPGASATLSFTGTPTVVGPTTNSAVAQGCTGLAAPPPLGLPCASALGIFVTTTSPLPLQVLTTAPAPNPATVPAAPSAVHATAGNAQADVSWVAPVSDGGSPITSYTVTSNPPAASATVAAPATAATLTGLTNGTAYTFTVTATNAVGTSAPSAASNSVTPVAPVPPATVPGAPTAVTATAGDAQATVSWTAPASDGGSPITSYTVTSSPAGASAIVTAPATTAILTGLTNGTAYTFTVTATNAVGTSAASAASNSVTPAAPVTGPGPTDLQVTGFATTGQPTAGSLFSYILQVKNNGNATALNVQLTDVLPSGETVAWAGPGCSNNAGVVTCQIPALPRGASSFLAVTVKAPTTPRDVRQHRHGKRGQRRHAPVEQQLQCVSPDPLTA